jgi:hypothetical protein
MHMQHMHHVASSSMPYMHSHSYPKSHHYHDPKGKYIGLNVYDMTPRGGIYGAKCTCNV